jgi:hypothetical protein
MDVSRAVDRQASVDTTRHALHTMASTDPMTMLGRVAPTFQDRQRQMVEPWFEERVDRVASATLSKKRGRDQSLDPDLGSHPVPSTTDGSAVTTATAFDNAMADIRRVGHTGVSKGLEGAARVFTLAATVEQGAHRAATVAAVSKRRVAGTINDEFISQMLMSLGCVSRDTQHYTQGPMPVPVAVDVPLFTYTHECGLLVEAGLKVHVGDDIIVTFPACVMGGDCVAHLVPGRVDDAGMSTAKPLMAAMSPEELMTAVSTGIFPTNILNRMCILCYRHFRLTVAEDNRMTSKIKRLSAAGNFFQGVPILPYRNSCDDGEYRFDLCLRPLPDMGTLDIVATFALSELRWCRRSLGIKGAATAIAWFVDQSGMRNAKGAVPVSNVFYSEHGGGGVVAPPPQPPHVTTRGSAIGVAPPDTDVDAVRRVDERPGAVVAITEQVYTTSVQALSTVGQRIRVAQQGVSVDDDNDAADDDDGADGAPDMDPIHVPCALPGYDTATTRTSLAFGHVGDTVSYLAVDGPHRVALEQIQTELGGAPTGRSMDGATASLAARFSGPDANNDVVKMGPGAAFRGTCPDF